MTDRERFLLFFVVGMVLYAVLKPVVGAWIQHLWP